MARQMRTAAATGPSPTVTTTLTIANTAPSSSSQNANTTLVLKLNRKKKKVTWKEGTVDNEFMQKKSSKKCCIFHKQKPFDEDTSSDEEGDAPHDHRHSDHHPAGDACGSCSSNSNPDSGSISQSN